MNIGILTGGGYCPGLNSVIRAVVRKTSQLGHHVIGIRDGWKGLLELNYTELNKGSASGILHLGGTILGTSRTNPFAKEGGPQKVIDNIKKLGLDVLVAIGGGGSLGGAFKTLGMGRKTICGPKH